MILEVGTALLLPVNLFFMSVLIETAVTGRVDIRVAALFAATALIQVIISYYRKKLSLLLSFQMSHVMQRAFLEKCSRLPFETFGNEDALNLLTMAEEATDGGMMELFSGTVDFIGNALRLGGLILIFAMTGFALPLLYLLLLVIIMMLDYKAIRLMNDMFENQSEKERRFRYYETELSDRHSLSYLRAVRGLEIFQNRVSRLAKELGKERIGVTVRAQKYSILSNLLILVWFVGSIVVLSFGTFNGQFSLSIFVVCVSALSTALDVSEQISVGISGLAKDVFYIDKYLEMMNLHEQAFVTPVCGAPLESDSHLESDFPLDADVPLIEFENVSFTYPGSETSVLNHLSFSIYKGERVSLVGANGRGKTTVTKLILGLYLPTEGRIRISGKDLSELSVSKIHETFSAVFQDYAGFDLTLKENIALSGEISNEIPNETS
ncbi:MAG: ABC transporter ATP-binding protein, partial [Bacillota bacterium]|nr:ABC transporter ATP-binding protein [Bacillota bacterium]